MTRGEFLDAGSSAVDGPSQGTDSAAKGDSGGTGDAAKDTGGDVGAQASLFTGSFMGNQPTTTAAQHHMSSGVGVTPGLGVDCLGCHKSGGSGKEFLFAGTIFQDVGGTMPASDIEVRVLDSANNGFSAYSDSDGNFWFVKVATDIAFPAQSGARNASMQALMTNPLSAGSCNVCHDKNTTDPTHIP